MECARTALRMTARTVGCATLGVGASALGGLLPSAASARSAAREALLMRLAHAFCRVHGVELRVRGRPPRGPCVLVANHLSWLDPIIIAATTPFVPIAKSEVGAWPVLGRYVAGFGTLFVDRASPLSGALALLKARRMLEAGGTVLNFPEGTTTSGPLGPFKRGVFGLAARLDVPVAPVRVDYDDDRLCWYGDAALMPHYAKLLARPRARAFVTFATPLSSAGRSAEVLCEEARGVIARLARSCTSSETPHVPSARCPVPPPWTDALLSTPYR